MSANASSLRAQLSHPVIDADGHWLEFGPQVRERMRAIGGDKAVQGFETFPDLVERQLAMSLGERREQRVGQQAFWALPTKNTRDRATAMLPKLLYERLGELGIDYSILYPTIGLVVTANEDAAVRRAATRAFNTFAAEHFGPYADRMTPAAAIPMHTPEEAIEELEYVTGELGLKAVFMGSMIRRPIPAFGEAPPQLARYGVWWDVFGIDSDYDYDPVWVKCVELGVVPTFHSGGRGYALRNSPSNFVYNHVGHFASAGEAVCKALFLGGVTRRFPTLNFGFLEGGVGWACSLLSDLIEHWEKRKRSALEEVDPANLDRALLRDLAAQYGGEGIAAALEGEGALDLAYTARGAQLTGGVEDLDDFSACDIGGAEDFVDLFSKRFYFGCEADDRMNALAFNRKALPQGAQLNALFGSDIGHFDVADMAGVLPEAFELVEEGLMSDGDFRDFVFANPVRFWGEANPAFFKGTAVEREAGALLAETV